MKKLFEIYERNLALEAVRVTEAAALSASSWVGLGDEKAADAAADPAGVLCHAADADRGAVEVYGQAVLSRATPGGGARPDGQRRADGVPYSNRTGSRRARCRP